MGKQASVVYKKRHAKARYFIFDLKKRRVKKEGFAPKSWKTKGFGHIKIQTDPKLKVQANKHGRVIFTFNKEKLELSYERKTYDWILRAPKRKMKYIENAPPDSKLLGAVQRGSKTLLIFASFHTNTKEILPNFTEIDLTTNFKKEKFKHP